MINGVSFKGLYVLTGKPENARIDRDTIQDIPRTTLTDFLDETKYCRAEDGKSYYNEKNGDYYMTVDPKQERQFERIADEYDLDCVKVGSDAAPNNANVKKEVEVLDSMRHPELFKTYKVLPKDIYKFNPDINKFKSVEKLKKIKG